LPLASDCPCAYRQVIIFEAFRTISELTLWDLPSSLGNLLAGARKQGKLLHGGIRDGNMSDTQHNKYPRKPYTFLISNGFCVKASAVLLPSHGAVGCKWNPEVTVRADIATVRACAIVATLTRCYPQCHR
jgi:hypothetical protein